MSKKENTKNAAKETKDENIENEATQQINEEQTQDKETSGQNEPTQEEKLKKELETQKDKYIRLCAEYDNFRKRTANEKLMIYADATACAVSEILPIADSVNMALESLKDKEVPPEFSKGIELIASQLNKSFEKLKVEEFCEVGDEFNPDLHNAISKIDDENLAQNTVSAVYQKGYKLKDKIIRHAMVQVANT